MALLSLIAKLGLDKTGFEQGLSAAGNQVAKFGSKLKSQLAAAFGVAAITAFTKSAIASAAAIGDMAQRLDISTDDAQQFALAMKMGGKDIEDFAVMLEKLRAAQTKAASSGKEGPFAAFNIELKELQQLDAPTVLRRIGDELNRLGVQSAAGEAIFSIFGVKGGGKVIQMLQDLETATEKVSLLSPSQIKAAQEFDDAWVVAIQNVKAALAGLLTDPKSTLGDIMDDVFPEAFRFTPKSVRQAKADAALGDEMQADADNKAKAEMVKQAEEMAIVLDLSEKIKEVDEKNRVAALSASQKLAEAKEKLLRLEDEAHALDARGAPERERLEAWIAQKEQFGKVAEMERGMDKSNIERFKPFAGNPLTPTDSLGRIGAFSGGGQAQLSADIRKSVNLLMDIKRGLLERGIRIQGEF